MDTETNDAYEYDDDTLQPVRVESEPVTYDVYEYDSETPRPVDAESVANGTFERLEEGQGAVAGKAYASAAHLAADDKGEELDKRTIILLVAGMLAALVVVVVFVIGRLSAPTPSSEGPAAPEQTVVMQDQGVTVRGYSYRLQEKDGAYQLVEESQTSGANPVALGDLPGTPVGMVLYDGAIIIPENLKDGSWDIMAYTIGSGWSQLMGQDGHAVTGQGELTDVQLEGSRLVLTSASGRQEVPLVW